MMKLSLISLLLGLWFFSTICHSNPLARASTIRPVLVRWAHHLILTEPLHLPDRYFACGGSLDSKSIADLIVGLPQSVGLISMRFVNLPANFFQPANPTSKLSTPPHLTAEILEWSGKSWEPYVADDVQVQFEPICPENLVNRQEGDLISELLNRGLFHTSFKVPDVYGVLQFKVEYKKLGYTKFSLSKQMAGFLVFSFVYLYHK
ncbi:hypothetical protein IGI04_008730 [Brassica rapa subsp. trilocularis]|uniref:OST48 middle domain-containing protein n=1 Tax=Brassica rapa subsp. trilocularis TaxID=1813537 RepID=A0ABQ7NNG8_BRACM|nr:hypothetical protein IGI04_008730 [Brassica rapa subsp. trilocularis]